MKALDRAGSLFLRSILKRMKALGLNQSALARRMNVSRAYVSKVFAGDVNISFQTACRFAKALEMDFMPGLAPKKESGARRGVRGIVAAVFCALAFACQAEVFSVPSWLPEDQRFEVSGTSNEIAQVERTLAAMRDAFHPKLIEMMRRGDSATNGCPSAMGPTMEWVVHVSLPGATNETAYFESYRKPLTPSAFDFNLLTNRAARLSYLPPTAKLSLAFGKGRSLAVPGVDYPGVAEEDAGSTPSRLRLALCAPKWKRCFTLHAEVEQKYMRALEVKLYRYAGHAWYGKFSSDKNCPLSYNAIFEVMQTERARFAVFVREKGGPWGAPSFVTASPDPICKHRYNKKHQIESIDYGAFRDVYTLDDKDRIVGFMRVPAGLVRGEVYSNIGEKIIDGYADDRPKTTRKVVYSVVNGKLCYAECDEDIHHKNEPPEDRAKRW